MPEEKDKIKKLYDTFVSDGYDMESEEDFRKNLLDSTKRKAAYHALVKDGYDMEPFEEFESNIGFGKERTSSQQSGNSASGTVEEPISPANEQTWQPTEKEKVAMLTETDRIMNDVKSHTQTFNERIDNMQEYGINPGLQTKEGKMIFNPESGKLEKTFLTPAGNRYYSKSLADMESFQYRQAADMSIGGQLRKANLRLQELKAKQEERASEVHKEWAEETENNKAPLAAILGAATYTPRQQSDKENRALSVAIRETEELIKNLEEQKDRENGVDVGFWRGFGRTMGDVRTWDFGMGDMRDAFTMMNADELKKENATEGEREAHDAMMGAIHEKQQAEERYSGNADFWNRAGVMTGYMPSFMLDFVLTGGGFNGLSSFSKGSTRLATKVISKETAEKMAQQGFKSYIKENGAKGLGRYATDWTIKALGTTADDLLVRAPLMANTVQAGKTTADIIDRKLGDVVVDENGNYDFSNDKTWGDAIWQSEANAIIENYSEMFGAHLDPVFTLGNMSKLAKVVGAKRIGTVLSKADASALNGIMGQTHQMFNKMGMSDYVGEVSEEYYGQLWRTMLNLDDAYQQNPDGTRTNLFASGQFHGDIWGGMALSMGLMGAGKHTLSAANYTSMKHGVNKADAKVNELLGKEVWEPLKETLDLTTNENIGEVAELIAGDKDFTINEKAAVLDYMERSLNLRGFNLASMAQSRGGNRNESVQQANDSYLDGYNIISSQEMNDAKNMYEYQRARVADLVDESMFAMIEENPIAALEFVNGNEQWNDEDKVSVIDYINAKQVYNGMIQRVRDDIDGRIEQSNSMIDARVNRNTGMIQGATMKQDERKVYVISGKLVPYDDGSGVSVTDSDNSIIIRDSETGALEQVSPDAVLSLDESQDPNEQKELAEQAIVEQFAREAADKIDGKVTFNPGDAYTITGQDGSQMQVQIIANEDGIVDNGDGTVNVSDGVNIFPLAKETIQQQADAANLARVAQFEQQRTIENAERKQEMQEAERPQYALNDIVSLTDENGVTVRGNITADADADGKYEVFTEAPINGKRVNLFTRDELDNMLLEHNGVAFERPVENESNNGAENIPENDNNAPQNIPAMQRIPKDEQGNPLYEQADSDTAWDAIVEQTEGDEDMAQTVVDGMVADKEEALKKLEKAKSKGGNSIAEKIASEKERKAAIDAAKQELLVWQKIAGTAKRRKMEADDERRRIADEAAALRKAEEEKLRAEREEAERIEREALNGVPDMVDDKPQDARARGYRRMNGHKIDRQEPVQALMGKEVSVKFSDDAIVGGRISVIDANLLQPSHVQGVRNPLHFIDEAQPKERNDEASVLSARKIAGNIRPEEITSSVTAYTGAPTINARGEVIQGNNRSDALRQMWYGHKDQAEQYKQYLKDHADEFGLRAEDIDSVERPVLVNMLEVDDTEAINLGQFVAQDTESGGIERIKPKNIMQKMGNDMRSFANLLLASSDEETSFAGLVDANGTNVLKWMMQKGYITPTQYSSAFDSKGNLTAEAKNDLRGIMYQSIFKGGSVRLEEMFNALPVKAQKAILATAFRDYDSPNAERMVEEIQNSIRAYYALSQDKQFTEAKNFKEARIAVESWKHQYQIDDATGESYLPADNFSNFALLLATMYKGETQGIIQNTFNRIYDLIQGTQEATLFEQPDNTPRTLAQAIYETLNIIYDGQQRSNVLVGDTATGQRGQQGSRGDAQAGERVEDGNGTADSGGRIERDGGRSGVESEDRGNKEEENDATEVIGRSMTADEAQDFIADMELSAEIAPEIDLTIENWDALFGEDGIVTTPIGNVKMGENQFTKLMRQGRNGKLGMIKPTLEHPHAIIEDVSEAKEGDTTERPSSYVFIRSFKKADGSRYYYFTSITVSKDGKEVVVSNQEKRRNAIANLLTKGKMVWKHADDVSNASDMAQGLYSPQGNVSDLATEGTDAPQTTMLSDNKGTNNSRKSSELGEKIAKAEAEVDVNPTDKQKEAGNYKKGHVQVGVFDITIEQPKGSVRSGVDANGNKWETTMQNTYGYIRGTEGVDGDHIDVFLSNDIDGWNGRRVFVVDQYNEDGSFDEHKVMLGFNETDDAEAAYFANYDNDWAKKHKTVVTGVNLEDFEKWIDSSHRKTKAFAEYKSVKSVEEQSSSTQVNRLSEIKSRIEELHKEQEAAHGQSDIFEEARIISEINDLFTEQRKLEQNNSNEETTTPTDAAYTITQAQYTTKRGKVLDMHLVKFNDELRDTVRKCTTMFAKQLKGWWDKEKQGFMMRSKEDAERLAEYATDAQSQQPVSMSDMQALNDGNVQFVEPQLSETSKPEERQEYTPVWQYSVSVDKETGLTTLRRDDVSGPIPIGDGRFNYTANSPEEMLEIVRNPKNFNQELRDAVETILENKVKIREIVRTEKAAATEQESKPENKTSGNRLVTDERYAELRERMRKKLLGQMNMGIDPEILAIGTEMAVYHLEKGARKFAEYATAMIADLGDAIRPYLKAFYNGARDLPEVAENGLDSDMTPYDEVQKFDVANFDKTSIDALATAETVTRETEVEQEAEIAQERIKKSRPARKKNEKKAVNSQQSNELGLFDDLIDNNKNNEHGLQRTDAERSEGLSANGNRHGQGLSRGTETGSESEQQAGRGTDNEGERTSDAVNRIVRPRLSDAITEKKNTHNNHSERGKDHAPTSVDARIEANIKAIELAKQLLESGERATEKQMQTLRKFSGWGGLGKAFNEGTSYAPNPIAKKLRELLGEKAYQEAVMSANSAYYTPAYVVDTLWDIAEQMGFNGGNILEGSAGIGNILGQMPTNISERSDIHAIEIDGTSGGILSLLYPDAKVEIQGFEQTRIPNGSVDLAITNVPFVTGLRVNDTTGDKDLSKKFHNIHDFCIAKNVRKLREGGLGIFITSNGTLDNSKKLRDWIVNEGGADFVGAFRMHNKTFGGAGVTSDIVVIRKRVNGQKSVHAIDVSDVSGERMAEYDTGETRKVKGKETPVIKQLSMDYNRYFIEHPENMAGEMHFAFEKGDTFRPTSKGLYPKQDKKQEEMLAEFVRSFRAEEFGERNTEVITDVMPGKKIGEVFVKDGKLYINSTASAQPLEVNANKVKGHTKVECFEAYTAIKKALAEVLSYQTENESDEGLKPLLDKLNKAYDDFVSTYGHFNKNTAIAFLRNDVDYANVFALEKFEETADEKGNRIQKFEKTDVFSKRVVEKDKEPTPANVKDGIIASIFKFGRVDIPYIAEQLGTGIEDVKKEIIESGYGFEDPVSRQMEASYQYLSGNIREKLRQAEENNENGEFDRNIKALQEVMPMEIPAHLIDFTLGSSWIDPKLYEDFVKERTEVNVRFTAVGGTWFMKEPYFTNYEKNRAMGVTSEMLGRTIMGHTLIEAAIQNRSITVSTTKKHYDGTTETITDKEATQACAAKIDEIRQDFKDWARQKMQSDPEMSERMERIYNDMFNNFVPMSIPDEFVPEYFGGASHKFKMRPHQGRAIVRGTQQPLLLAHEVGTGKTFTLISTAMEMRRLGTARKPMIVIQNATVGQFVASAKELYPNAKILTLEEADRSADGRKNFYAKIRYNDWDMIVVPQSTFEFIPDSEEREMAFVQDKIEEKMLILEQMKEEDPDGKNMITRQAEREIELLEEQLAGLADNASKKRTANDEKKRAVALQNAEVKAMEMLDRRTDDVENFDDMGIDALLVDEAHEYKHLGFATAMQRGVKGVDPSYSKKSQGVFLKTQAVLEKNNGRNVIFATGTPISNTAAEIWTFMRYLMPADTMKEYGIYYFDDFVRNFGNIQQMLEFTTSGKFKENNRFAGYVNLPELVRIWSGVSDTVLTKEAGGVKDKIPEMEGGKAQDLYLPQTRALRSIMKFVKSELEHYEQMSGKEKKENSHIPLTMYGIAKAAAVDARLVQSDAEDDQNSKTNEAVRQTLRSLKETADYKGTVAIFADNYQNKQSGFNLYDDIRNKLIAEGVPADEIVVMRSGMTVKKKLEIFEKVNRGEVRVILGSTFTLGTGVNIQERLHTLIHLDAPNRPMDYTQRNGRILRQGNLHKDMNKPVRILRFGVEDSLDVTAYQRLKTKGAIADSIMNGKQMMNNSMTNRVLEEEEDVFGDTVAQLSGSEYAMLKNNAEKNVRKYASRKKQWETDQTYIHNAKPRLKAFIKDAEKRIEDNGRCLEAVRSSFPDGQFKEIVTGKHRFTSVDTMDDFFKEHNKSVLAEMKQMKDGEISGEQKRELIIQIGDFSFVVTTKLTRKTMSDGATLFNDVERRMTYSCLELGIEDVPVRQNLLRNAVEDITDNVITGKDFAERLSAGERSKKHNEAELKELLSREGKPFEYEEELAQAKAQLEEYAELMKKELEEKEAKYAEMDASVETANNISASEEDDELKREGGGAYTDDEVSYENDPVAKLLGQSRRTAKQRREFAQRERQRMAERVEILAEKLHLDNVEIVTDASVLDGKKQRAKGFYSKSTGKITIVIPNHTSAFDVEQTLLHEAVAHYGLRQLFGEHFDTFLDNVFNNADENIRKRIVDMAAKNGWNFRKATEEYLASLAEQTEFENINASWWRQIKDFFLNMLHKIGFDDFRGVTLTDNELRYILWRSYENLAEPGRYRSILGEAADVAKQYELGVGNYSDTNRNPNFAADSNDELYRDGSPEMHERELARDRYERRVKTGMFQSQEALQDSMLGLKEAMQAILGQGTNIEDVDGFENAYLGENRLSSVNKAEADAFAHTLFKPMLDEVAKLARTEAEREELTDYMMAKHGLERNTYMRNEAINNGATNADQTDYAGLTALTGMDNVTDAETEAQIMVNDYEQAHDTADLWKKVNAVSKAILSKSYECGMMSKATFDKISDMYDFYIPLRGFDEKTSTEAYAYLTHKQSAFNAPIKKAEGRRSKADDPFANLQSMAEGAIMQGNRNKLVKQRFLNFALNHPSDLVSVSDIWVEYDTVTNEWKPVFPDNIDSTDTPEEVERKMLDFETKMKSLAQQYPDRYKHGKDTVNIPYRIVESRDMRQHQIIVKRGGRDYVITINGNPRAAQALNGQTNPDNDMSGAIGAILRAGENINRQLSAFYTTRNPDFIVSNFMRDMLYTNTMTWIRESPNYALRFHRNYMYANPVRIKQLLAKHRKGTLDMGNKTEAMFHQFMMNGGETGYANIRDIEQHKNDIRRELKKSSGKIPVKKAWDLLGERFDEYNRAVENCARFAAFMTSREMGRSIDRSIYDAKEISVNFNKKGSGAKFYDSTGQTKAGNASALVSGLGRSGYVFWNAAIQGTTNFGRQVKRHPAKSFTGIAAMFLLGAIVAYLGGDDDDDDDKNAYYNLPEYVRRSNILFRAGNSWVSIPLPVEYRAVYGMGELMISILNGKEHLTGGEIAESITGQVTQILPIDLLEGGGGLNAFVPSAYKPLWEAYVAEKSWTGMPLYKDTPWNKDMPEWTKAYKSANKYIVGLANVMNEATGGDSYTKGAIDFNPAKIEYMLNGYFGGVFGTIDKLSKTVETVTGNREYDPRSFLLANRLVKAGDERTEYRAVNNEYFRLKEEHDRLKSRLKHYEEDTDNDIFDYAEKIDFLYNSPEYERYEIFEDYRRDIDDLYNELNDTVDDEERKNIEAELNELKKEMIEEMNKTRK
jgi:N12 class adenine-specific DNA methylase